MQRLLGAAGTVFIAAAVNLATGFFTDHKAVGWWISGAVLLSVGGVIQWWLPVTPTPEPSQHGRQNIQGTRVGGSVGQSMASVGVQDVTDTHVSGDLNQTQRSIS
ncbi:hypothetical protein AGRA3207_007312 [Actinomadura graeca]|uniref:Uncharacterized protein n=1 Tax=Actinomadura graeca TaxID=2750812 RepID=A0ABX8R5G4_9ACTN|nr:hypothetical protein [Actinomadura graeca]QXJ25766.1 hypothetical protein AGRA3207_007312 [Actinomadura graeca]